MENISPIALALLGTGFAALATTLGSALVFFMKKDVNIKFHQLFLGFAAGIMIAASVWSLIIPAFERAAELGMNEWLPVTLGFILGGLFLFGLDGLLSKLQAKDENPSHRRAIMLVSALTLHNIPEGLAVGLILGTAAQSGSTAAIATGAVLSIGIALHNFPEGAAVSLPLRKEGMSKKKAFGFGALSGIVEPIAGVFGVVLAGTIESSMPLLLGFAAGAMIYVVVEELIPEAHEGEKSHFGTLGAMAGFIIMMLLDVMFS